MASISRNASCPCGSGKKYKNCHLNVVEEQKKQKMRVGPAIVGSILGVGAGIAIGMWKGPTLGFAIGSAIFILILIGVAILSPPPPSGGTADASAINFGSK